MSRIRLSYWPVLLLALWSCRKDVEQFDPYAPSAQELSNWLTEQVPVPATHTTFALSNLAEDKVLETASGTRIFLIDPDHLFANAAGQTIQASTCTDLKIDVTEVFDKSDVLARGLYTVAEDGTLFESGGMVKVTVTCNNEPLSLLSDRNLKIQLPNTTPLGGFFVFNYGTSAWSKSNQEVFEAEWPTLNSTSIKGYELLVKNLGWVACGRLLTEPVSPFCVELPTGFGGQNTLAYLVFKNQVIIAPLQFDLGQNKFCYPKAPIGYQVQMAAVSKLGTQYWLGKGQTEIGTNATFPLSNQQTTEESVLNFVRGL